MAGKIVAALERKKAELGRTREELELANTMLSRVQANALALAERTPEMAIPALVAAGTATGAYSGGFTQALLEAKGSGKVGPVPTVAAVGAAGALAAATQIEDPDFAVAAVSLCAGLVAGPLYELGREHYAEYAQAMSKVQNAEKKAA